MLSHRSVLAALCCVAAAQLAAPVPSGGYVLWNNFRTSALHPDNLVTVRIENPHGEGLVNTILYLDGTILETALSPVMDGQSTLAALTPGPVGQRRYYGFRLLQGSERDLLPVRLADGIEPVPGQLTQLTTDPLGDEVFGRPHLDLVECRVSYSGTHLYAALRNSGGGFPVVQSLTFFSYLFGLSNPAEPEPSVVWALLHTYSTPGSGLYRVMGSGLDDLVKIGNITVQEFAVQNTLLLSCLLSDLLADTAFAAWYDLADPRVAVGAFTQRITILGGAQEADRITGGRLHLRALSRDPGPNTLPQLSGFAISPPGAQAVAEIVYTDADAHCPVFAEIVLSGTDGGAYPLYPQSLNYGGPVVYRSQTGILALVNGSWTGAETRFSDNTVDVVTANLAVAATPEGETALGAQLRLRGAPNPFTGQTVFSFLMPAAGSARLAVHDLAGRTVAVLIDSECAAGSQTVLWGGRDRHGTPQPAGVYFYRLQTRHGEAVRRITLVR